MKKLLLIPIIMVALVSIVFGATFNLTSSANEGILLPNLTLTTTASEVDIGYDINYDFMNSYLETQVYYYDDNLGDCTYAYSPSPEYYFTGVGDDFCAYDRTTTRTYSLEITDNSTGEWVELEIEEYQPTCNQELISTQCVITSSLSLNTGVYTNINVTIYDDDSTTTQLTATATTTITGNIYFEDDDFNWGNRATFFHGNATTSNINLSFHTLEANVKPAVFIDGYDGIGNTTITFDENTDYNIQWRPYRNSGGTNTNHRLWFAGGQNESGTLSSGNTVQFGDTWWFLNTTKETGFNVSGFIEWDGLLLGGDEYAIHKDGFLAVGGVDYNDTSVSTTSDSIRIWVYGFSNWSLENKTAPTILTRNPTTDPTVTTGDTQSFNITVSEPDNDTLSYVWTVNDSDQSINNSVFNYNTTGTTGTSTIGVMVSDPEGNDTTSWTITVEEYVPLITGYVPSHTADDIAPIVTDGIGFFGVFLVSMASIIGIAIGISALRNYRKKGDS